MVVGTEQSLSLAVHQRQDMDLVSRFPLETLARFPAPLVCCQETVTASLSQFPLRLLLLQRLQLLMLGHRHRRCLHLRLIALISLSC